MNRDPAYRPVDPWKLDRGVAPMSHVLPSRRGRILIPWTDACIPWEGSVGSHGYGQKSDRSLTPRVMPAHRWVFMKTRGPIPAGMAIDHLCNNVLCVNPRHLEPVTPAENNRRSLLTAGGRRPARARTLCPRGHDRTDPANIHVGADGKRRCVECERLRAAAYRKRRSPASEVGG